MLGWRLGWEVGSEVLGGGVAVNGVEVGWVGE